MESGEHLATYASARALLALAGDTYATRKWAAGEAVAFFTELEREPEEVFKQIAQELLPSLQENEGSYTLAVLDYAQHGRDLAHQAVEEGRVWLDHQQILHLLKRSIENKLLASVPRSALHDAPVELKKAAEELRAKLPKYEIPLASIGGKLGPRGLYLARACIQELRKGASEGKRWYASMALSLALRHDRIPLEQAKEIITEFANNCSKGARPFTAREAITTLEWVYKRDGPARISCRNLISQGLIPDYCPTCPYKGGRRKRNEEQ